MLSNGDGAMTRILIGPRSTTRARPRDARGTLRYPYEVRDQAEYFESIKDEKIPKDMLELASHIVETKAGHFDPSKFDDRYEDALKDLLKKKQEGKPIERPERREPTNVVNLMEALRRRPWIWDWSLGGRGASRRTG